MGEIKLKPCPFCGHDVGLTDRTSEYCSENPPYLIECGLCNVKMYSEFVPEIVFDGSPSKYPTVTATNSRFINKIQLVNRWNRRLNNG